MTHFSGLRHWLCAALVFLAPAAAAHEFWLEPVAFQIQPGETISAHLKAGQMLKGSTYRFLPDTYERFEITGPDGRRAVSGRAGDLPALNQVAPADGLHVVNYQSGASTLRWDEFAKFADFVESHGQNWAVEAHHARGLPDVGFVEAYVRFAKTLVKVGQGRGRDIFTGMLFELVLLTNPYAPGDAPIEVQVLLEGRPFAGTDLHVFQQPDGGEVTKTVLHLDEDGRAIVPRGKGGLIMLNAVQMIEAPEILAQKVDAVWMSLWASTSFWLE